MQMLDSNKKNKKGGSKMVKKPWGSYQTLEKNKNYWLKKLFVKKGEELSLQSHKNREEFWVLLKGEIKAQKNNDFKILKIGDSLKIEKNEKHRIIGIENSVVFEVALGQPQENDIIRYEDKYGRTKK